MSFQAVSIKSASIGASALTLSSTLFNFASSDLEGAQKVTILPSSASVYVGYTGTTPTAALGIPVSTGTSYTVTGAANVARLQIVSQTTVLASVIAQIEK